MEPAPEPIPTWVLRLWDAWNLRVMMLISLAFQIVLVILGSHRKHVSGLRGLSIRVIVCFAYVMADWVAFVSIGKLSDFATEAKYFKKHRLLLRVLWAPLLLVQLGSPDTITAYSMKDAHYWWSIHTLKLAPPAAVLILLIHVLVRRWSGSGLLILTFPLIVAGIIKYGERVWALWSAKRAATTFFKYNSICLKLLDRGLHTYDDFEAVEIVSGYMYDVIFTKASIIYTRIGCFLRFISFFCTVSVLLGFSIITKHVYSEIDVIITYLLLVGAVVLDIYALLLILCYSDWAIVWPITKNGEESSVTPILRALARLSLNKWKKRWSNSMVQINLVSFCLYKNEPTVLFSGMLKLVRMDKRFQEYRCQIRVDMTEELKTLIVKQVREITGGHFFNLQNFNERGEFTLQKASRRTDPADKLKDLEQTVKVDFDESIIKWHIATNICYTLDPSNGERQRVAAKILSDYMMYLLVVQPHMLPIAGWRHRFEDMCTKIKLIFTVKMSSFKPEEDALKTLLTETSSLTPELLTDHRTLLEKTVPDEVLPWESSAQEILRMAKTLMKHSNRWEIISGVWTEMMCYAAAHCPVDHHVEELRRGGELLTHVWLLLTTFCFNDSLFRTRWDDESDGTDPDLPRLLASA